MDDAALIARVLDGDRRAFGMLVDRYYEPCRRYAVRMLGHAEDAEDALQETFLRAYRGLGRYHERERFRGWLYRILINQCRTSARRRGRLASRIIGDENAVEQAVSATGDGSRDLRDALQITLEKVPPLLREAVLLKYAEGLDYTEMARVTGSSVSALKMRVKRACDTMRPRLEDLLHE